jgi:4-hydroxymandelate oxidase
MTRRAVLGTTLGAVASVAGASETVSPGCPDAPTQAASARAEELSAQSLLDFERLAERRLSHMAYEYVAGGAENETTLRENRAAFERLRLHPRVLVDVSGLDTRVTIFGQTLEFPILLAPTAYHKLVHPEGELATVRGARASGATLVVSSFATTSVEDMAREAAGAPLWFQLYAQTDRTFTRDLVSRAEAAGCRALCLTVDSPVVGARNREARSGFALPAGMQRENLKSLGALVAGGAHRPRERQIYSAVLDPRLTWKEVDWLRSVARIPLLLKGVLSPLDAQRAVGAGVDGLIVSNHGGRNLDTVPATLDALPAVAEAVEGRIPLLLDGGVRRGTDVLKALALGARAVLIGRPYLWALAVRGADGVSDVVRILRTELEMAMALSGRATVKDIDRSVLWTRGPAS